MAASRGVMCLRASRWHRLPARLARLNPGSLGILDLFGGIFAGLAARAASGQVGDGGDVAFVFVAPKYFDQLACHALSFRIFSRATGRVGMPDAPIVGAQRAVGQAPDLLTDSLVADLLPEHRANRSRDASRS